MKKISASLAASFLLFFPPGKEYYLVVGTYTRGKSEGIYVYKFNGGDGTFKEISHVKTSNPSFVTVSPDEKFVYAVHEEAASNGKGGEISAFSFDKKKGTLSLINEEPTLGDHPCYVTIDKTGKWVIAGNYTSGSLSVLPVKTDGSLGRPVTTIQHEGSSVNNERQSSPHVHCTVLSADNRFLFVPDLGMDKVMIYAFDEKTGQLSPAAQPFAQSRPGAGPRHFTFHPNNKFAYLVEEMGGTIEVFDYNDGSLKNIQTISTMAAGDSSYPGSADIHVSPDGKFLYASNRSKANNIAIFKVNARTGMLTLVGHQPTFGKAPRNFNFDPSGNFLLAANQDSDDIVIFKRDLKTGLLSQTGKIEVGNPVCVKWINVN